MLAQLLRNKIVNVLHHNSFHIMPGREDNNKQVSSGRGVNQSSQATAGGKKAKSGHREPTGHITKEGGTANRNMGIDQE